MTRAEASTEARAAKMTGGEAVVRALQAEGVDLVFGIPGTHTLEIHRHLRSCGIRHVTPRHEQGGGYAADGYARISGRPGVVLATTGPGVLNVATPAATAYADSVPMLIVSPSMPTDVEGRDTGFLHETKDQHGAMDALVAWSRRASSPADAARLVHEAFEHLAAGRPRPVHVEVPVDVLAATGPVGSVKPSRLAAATDSDEEALHRAVALLSVAERPGIVVGGGARRASAEVSELAERLGAGVVTTVNGKGILSERHPLSLGASIRLRAAQRWLAERDVLIAVGTELGESDLWGPLPEPAGRVVRIDVDPSQLNKNVAADVGISGDAAAILRRLLGTLPDRPPARAELDAVRTAIHEEALRDGAIWLDLIGAIGSVLGPDGILAADSAMAAYYGAVHFLPMQPDQRLIYPTGYATLGYAVPAAIGARLAAPDRPVVALAGDGGLLFTVAELTTAAELGFPLPVVVANNGGYGEIRAQMEEAGIEPIGVDLLVPDLPALGAAFGGAGVRADGRQALERALGEALERHGPTVIEVPA